VIGIEVKYHAGLSSDDDVDNSGDEPWKMSANQLSRYQRMLEYQYKHKKKLLVFLAPRTTAIEVYKNITERNILSYHTAFTLLSWQELLQQLQDSQSLVEANQQVLLLLFAPK